MITKGQRYNAPTMGCTFEVTRVALDGTWADLKVARKGAGDHPGARWTKRLPLTTQPPSWPAGRKTAAFPFPVELIGGTQ